MKVGCDHWLEAVKRVISPNRNERPNAESPSLIVMHGISLPPNQFGGPYIEALFTNTLNPAEHSYFAEIAHLKVSAHLLVRRDGEVIQFVPFNERAWHAGQSCFEGRENCNDFSIGIELEGADHIPYTDQQYQAASSIVSALHEKYAETRARVVGHSDIAPGRKTDPGPVFDWVYLQSLLSVYAK